MRGIFALLCALALPACTKAPTDESGPTQAEEAVVAAPEVPASSAPVPTDNAAMMPSVSAQTDADQYLRLAMDAAQRRFDVANAACPEQPVPDDCVSSATAALEQEQAAARVEHQRQLQELHQGG